jgi:hypothetical protein
VGGTLQIIVNSHDLSIVAIEFSCLAFFDVIKIKISWIKRNFKIHSRRVLDIKCNCNAILVGALG